MVSFMVLTVILHPIQKNEIAYRTGIFPGPAHRFYFAEKLWANNRDVSLLI